MTNALLREARVLYRERALSPRGDELAFFEGGTRWMARALGRSIDDDTARRGSRLAFHKYLAATIFATAASVCAWRVMPLLAPVSFVFAFYAVEVQGVFVLPCLIAGSQHPFASSRSLMLRSGGTLSAMARVLPIACSMMFSGLFRVGPLRKNMIDAWCEGCLAVVLWYERS